MRFFNRIILSLFFFLFFPLLSYAENFFIQEYKVAIEVNENKSAKISEEILVEFTSPSHGIIRDIPHSKATISNINVSESFEVSDFAGKAEIKIGSAMNTITGPRKYVITYNYNYRDNKAEFYHNIIGPEWGVPIRNASFSIKMPKEFDGSKAGLSIGYQDQAGFEGGAKFRVLDNIYIEGFMERTLEPGEGITFRTEVPQGYFNSYSPLYVPVCVGLSAILAFASFIIWTKYGKDDHVTPVVTFDVPEGLNPLLAEMAYKEKATLSGLSALLVELANKGHVEIQNDKRNFTLNKISDCQDDNLGRRYIHAIFGAEKTITRDDLKLSHTYYGKCEEIVNSANENRTAIYDMKTIKGNLPRAMIFIIAAIYLIGVFAFCDFSISSLFCASAVSIIFCVLFIISPVVRDEWNKQTWAYMALTGLPLALMPAVSDIVSYDNINIVGISAVCLLIALFFTHYLPKRSHDGKMLLGELLGLRKFIKTAELPELEAMAAEHPQQFYKILPYAYVLGVSGVWIKKLDKFMQTHPMEERPRYNVRHIHRFARTVRSLSVPSLANGGKEFASGGGFLGSSGGGGGRVGRGGGGGGGRSW